MNDVKVINTKTGTILIEDIFVDVPHGVVVSISAEKAHRSKDLWRLISQRLLFQFHGGSIHSAAPHGMPHPAPLPVPTVAAPPPPVPTAAAPPTALVSALEEQNRLLREEMSHRDQAFAAVLIVQQERFNEMAALIRGVSAGSGGASSAARAEKPASDAPSGDAPLFIPSTIKPTDVKDYVNVQKDEGQAGGVGAASAALRKIREKGPS
jgi:hypothetical protein